jgi:ribosomal-protein-alanine N-acetyltransferase
MPRDRFDRFPELATERLRLRQYHQSHADDVFRLLGNPLVTRYEVRQPFTAPQQAERYVRDREFVTRERSEGIIWAISLRGDDEVIGDIGYTPDGLNAEVGFKLHPDHWNQGLISEALAAVVRFLFTETDTLRVEALARPANAASRAVLLKSGFRPEGLLRECEHDADGSHDMQMYSLLRREHVAG